MRNQIIILMTCALCIGHFSFSQEPIYNWGEPVTNDHLDRELDQLLSLGDEGFVLLRSKTDATYTTSYWMETYNAQMNLENTQSIPFNSGVMGDSYDLEEIITFNSKVYAFVSHWNKGAGANTLSIKEVDSNGEMQDVAELNAIHALKMGNNGNFTMTISDDESKLLVLSEQPFVKKTKEKIRLTCYDTKSFEVLWQRDEELSFDSKRAANNYIAVSNEGAAYMFKRVWEKPIWVYNMYSTDGSDDDWNVQYFLNLEDKRLEDYKMGFTNDNDFYIFGTTSTDPSNFNKIITGTWFMHYDEWNSDPVYSVKPISSDILTHFSNKKDFIKDFALKDVVSRADGKLVVILEETREEKDAISASTPLKYIYTYTYGDLLTICIDPKTGAQQWWQKFAKTQEVKSKSSIDPYGSIVYYMKENSLYILWNNTPLSVASLPPANWTEPDGTKYVKHKAFNEKTMHGTFMHVIEPNGSLTYSNTKFGLPLFNLHNGAVFEMSLSTSFCFEINGKLVIMASMHNGGKRYRFGFLGI